MSADPNLPKPPLAKVALTEHDALPAGTRFGEFEIIHALGVGGFGIVYLAQDHSLERQVALKEYMPAALAARGAGAMITVRSASFAETYAMGLRSFINEARLLARFDHPSLVKVYRFWEDNGTAYMVMPYLEGRTLRDARRAMGQAPDEAWIRGVLAPVLDALELLHREGVYHRDIAPDNILLPPDALPILLDFGAARRVISDHAQSLTAILKPSYAPIEQYAEMTTMRQGPWTDIYALGAVLHYLLFGVPPAPATARAVQPELDPGAQIAQRSVPGVSPRFIGVVAWMLGVRPHERPQNVASLRAVLNGQAPLPPGLHHAVTVPGATALMPVAPLTPMVFAPTRFEARNEPADHGEASASAAEMRFDPAHRPTAAPTPPPAVAPAGAPASAPTSAPASAPMRSTPPGTPPPTYVPPPRPPRVADAGAGAGAGAGADVPAAAAAPGTTPKAARRGLVAAGLGAALLIAAGVLWEFIGVIGAPRAVAPALAAASAATRTASATPVAAAETGIGTGRTVAPVAAAAAPPTPVEPVFDGASASGPGGDRPRPRAAVARAGESASEAHGASGPPGHRPHGAALARPRAGPVVAAGPASAREACGDRNFISRAICIDRECERPRFRNTPECVPVLEVKRRRAER